MLLTSNVTESIISEAKSIISIATDNQIGEIVNHKNEIDIASDCIELTTNQRSRIQAMIRSFNGQLKDGNVLMKSFLRLFKKVLKTYLIADSQKIQKSLKENLGTLRFNSLQKALKQGKSIYKKYITKKQQQDEIKRGTVWQLVFYRYNQDTLINCLSNNTFRKAFLQTLPFIKYSVYKSNYKVSRKAGQNPVNEAIFKEKHKILIQICEEIEQYT
ncbi:hypothetical protein FGO68_gene17608 [Halteria grandinella]|uniref:Uncharacterized protein n=1 Tax=Halteria grandinella TaxID=5974 RepID=A0A8J8NR42_HALGN|nr:hypothetical protein FGO68_gene17608 [Halteria grandinella]